MATLAVPATRLVLPEVTLCAVTSVNVAATVRALEVSLEQVAFGACKLLTDAPVQPCRPEIEVIPIGRIASSAAYSEFILVKLVEHVETSHCLLVQWDGHLLSANSWQPQFLNYDYIGASWPQFDDGYDVGNGGFSLRSRRLMEACRAPGFERGHPEDVAICRTNRVWLEELGMRFAPRELADLFATERAGDLKRTFGYHGVFNMPGAIGVSSFWTTYKGLDDIGTVKRDFLRLLWEVGQGRHGPRRAARLIADRVRLVWRKRS